MSLVALVLAAGLLAPASAAAPPLPDADPIGFHARADKAKVKLGEPFSYTVEIRHRPDESYALRAEQALAPFHAEGVRCRREVARGEALTTCTMRLSVEDLGERDVPDLAFDVDRPAGKARLLVPGPRVTGVGMLDPAADPESLALRDVAPPAPLLVRSFRLLFWALGVAAGVALVALAVVGWRRRRARRAAVPVLTPFERYEKRLAALEAEELPRRGRGEEHVARLSEAVREYLGAVTGLPALDLTTAELLAALAHGPEARVDAAGLKRFLGDADRVKFARQPASAELCAAATAYARALLERTRPAPAAAVAGGER